MAYVLLYKSKPILACMTLKTFILRSTMYIARHLADILHPVTWIFSIFSRPKGLSFIQRKLLRAVLFAKITTACHLNHGILEDFSVFLNPNKEDYCPPIKKCNFLNIQDELIINNVLSRCHPEAMEYAAWLSFVPCLSEKDKEVVSSNIGILDRNLLKHITEIDENMFETEEPEFLDTVPLKMTKKEIAQVAKILALGSAKNSS